MNLLQRLICVQSEQVIQAMLSNPRDHCICGNSGKSQRMTTNRLVGWTQLADFEYYKMCLIVGQRKKLKEVMDLFDNLNGALFPNHKASWRDQRDSRHSLVEEDDDLFREIAYKSRSPQSEAGHHHQLHEDIQLYLQTTTTTLTWVT